MSFNGSGTFVINSSGQPVVANTVISSTVFNALTADLATGLSTCITKDGQTTPTANIPMGTFKFTNLGNGSAATDSATLGQVQASTTKLVTVTGTDTITGTMIPALTAYATGQMFYFVAGGANTGAVTLNIDGLGARNVTRHGSVALVAGDILSGEVCVVVYDGTRFQLLNPASYTNLNVTGTLSAGSVSYTGTLTGGTGIVNIGSGQVYKDASGNVGIGTASPTRRLHVVAADGVTNSLFAGATFALRTQSVVGVGTVLDAVSANESTYQPLVAGGSIFAFQTGGTERMRLDSSGNLGIGTASPTYRVDTLLGAGSGNIVRFGQTGVSNGYTITTSGAALTHEWATAGSVSMRIDANANIVAGASAALATTATDGFLYVPTCAGVPTGTPTAITGMVPIVVDTTNNRWYFYSGGAWRNAGP